MILVALFSHAFYNDICATRLSTGTIERLNRTIKEVHLNNDYPISLGNYIDKMYSIRNANLNRISNSTLNNTLSKGTKQI